MITLNVNGKRMQTDADPDTPLLWVLRDHLDRCAEDAPLVVEAHLVLVVEAVSLTRDHHIVVAIQAQLDWSLEPLGRDRRDAGEQRTRVVVGHRARPSYLARGCDADRHQGEHWHGRFVEADRA